MQLLIGRLLNAVWLEGVAMKSSKVGGLLAGSIFAVLILLATHSGRRDELVGQQQAKAKKLAVVDIYDIADMTTAREPKPLSPAIKKGLNWLARRQGFDGDWSEDQAGQGAQSDLACSAIAVIAFLRAGNSAREGAYRETVQKAIQFINQKVRAGNWTIRPGARLTPATQAQTKLGPFADLFLANLALAELRGKAGPAERQVASALELTMNQVLALQTNEGKYRHNEGWAPILAEGLANKGIARARIQGTRFDEVFCERAFAGSLSSVLGPRGGRGLAGAPMAFGDAGVALYRISQGVTNVFDIANACRYELARIQLFANDPLERDNVRRAAERAEKLVQQFQNVRRELVAKLQDEQFLRGLGIIGGEELLSYWNVSELLVLEGGRSWEEWDAKMQTILERAQNADGSWTGQHCITGRTFCTAAALIVLMGDRTPFPRELIEQQNAKAN